MADVAFHLHAVRGLHRVVKEAQPQTLPDPPVREHVKVEASSLQERKHVPMKEGVRSATHRSARLMNRVAVQEGQRLIWQLEALAA